MYFRANICAMQLTGAPAHREVRYSYGCQWELDSCFSHYARLMRNSTIRVSEWHVWVPWLNNVNCSATLNQDRTCDPWRANYLSFSCRRPTAISLQIKPSNYNNYDNDHATAQYRDTMNTHKSWTISLCAVVALISAIIFFEAAALPSLEILGLGFTKRKH